MPPNSGNDHGPIWVPKNSCDLLSHPGPARAPPVPPPGPRLKKMGLAAPVLGSADMLL